MWTFIEPDLFVVYVSFIIFIIVVVICAIYVLILWKCPEYVGKQNDNGLDSTPFASARALLEARTEPSGYFKIDHYVLKSNNYE